MQKGSIRVETENIFPIIKKFLYSDHEIFLRELISNAVDASQKLKTLSSLGKPRAKSETCPFMSNWIKKLKHLLFQTRVSV